MSGGGEGGRILGGGGGGGRSSNSACSSFTSELSSYGSVIVGSEEDGFSP
jgi:hypothetical protein